MKKLLFSLATLGLLFSCTPQEEQNIIIEVDSIHIEQEDLVLEEGESRILSAIVLPENAEDKSINWSSSDESKVMVSSTGKVVAIAIGQAIITAKAGKQSDFITVTVEAKAVPVTGITLSPSSLTIKVGESQTIETEITPDNATNKSVIWSSSNPEVASIDNGAVLGIKTGSVTITATTIDGGKTAECPVTVKTNLAPSITIGAESVSAVSAVLKGEAHLETTMSSDLKMGIMWSTDTGVLPSNATKSEATTTNAGADEGTYYYYVNQSGLEPNTTYYYRSFITQGGVDTYGETLSFTTKMLYEIIDTKDASSITATSSILNGKVDLSDISIIYSSISYGFLWGDSEETQDKKIVCENAESGVFHHSLNELTHKTQYWYKSYLELDGKVYYGQLMTFTTDVVPVSHITLDKTEYTFHYKGATTTLKATVSPDDATDKTIAWSSSDEAVATVSETGVVTAIDNGNAIITASNVDHTVTATCSIIVDRYDIGDGTFENPYNAIAAKRLAKSLYSGGKSDNVYIKGKISNIQSAFSYNYGTANFYISDDTIDSNEELYCYGVYFLNNRSWELGDLQIKEGDEVLIYGKLTNYQRTTPETADKESYLFSLNGDTYDGHKTFVYASPSSFNFDGLEHNSTFSINAAGVSTWDVTSDSDWCTVTKGNRDVSVSVTRNNSGVDRNAIITISYPDVSGMVTVSQKVPTLGVSDSSFSYDWRRNVGQFTVTSNVSDWVVSCDADWVNVTVNDSVVSFIVDENTVQSPRKTDILITLPDNRFVTVALQQDALPDPFIDANNQSIAAEATTLSIDVKSNIKWQATVSSGITLLSDSIFEKDGTITIGLTENNKQQEVSHTLYLKAVDASLSYLNKEIVITQRKVGRWFKSSISELQNEDKIVFGLYNKVGASLRVPDGTYSDHYIQLEECSIANDEIIEMPSYTIKFKVYKNGDEYKLMLLNGSYYGTDYSGKYLIANGNMRFTLISEEQYLSSSITYPSWKKAGESTFSMKWSSSKYAYVLKAFEIGNSDQITVTNNSSLGKVLTIYKFSDNY